MTDHIPADKKWPTGTADKIMDWCTGQDISLYGWQIEVLRSMEEPPLPTLADMTPEERQACQWMQAQTWHEVGIILWVDEDSEIAQLITRANGVLERKFKDVTPLPGGPKLEWPGNHADTITAESMEDMQAGRVADFEHDLPRPEDVPEGETWKILPYENADPVPAFRVAESKYGPGKRWAYYRHQGSTLGFADDEDVTLIARLVPETPRKTLVTVEDYRDAPVGTIVKHVGRIGSQAFQKWDDGDWCGTVTGDECPYTDADMATRSRTVIWEP